MNTEQKKAYEWAIDQKYTSVAASYARTLAEYIRDCCPQQLPARLRPEELYAMDGPVWLNCVCEGGQYGCWGVCLKGRMFFPFTEPYYISEHPEYELYRAKPEGNPTERMLEALNDIEVDDYDCDGREMVYVTAGASFETVKKLFDAGFTPEELSEATENSDINLAYLAFGSIGAEYWSPLTGFLMATPAREEKGGAEK